MIGRIADRVLRLISARVFCHRFTKFTVLALVTFFAVGVMPAHAFWVGISDSPDPNTGNFTVSWSNPSWKLYTLQRRIAGGSWSYVQNTTGSSRSFTSHAAGLYSFRLRLTEEQCLGWPEPECYNVTTYSETTTVTVTESAPGVPAAITGPSTDYNGSYTLSWGSVSGATAYELQRQLNAGSWSLIQNTSSTSRSESSLSAGTYGYKVRACNSGGCSGYTSTKAVTVEAAPTTPAALTGPSTDYDSSYTISWNSSTNSSSYRLEEQIGAAGWAQIYSGSSLSQLITGNAVAAYWYRVKGCNAESVCSGWSSSQLVTVYPPPSTPTGLTGPTTDYDGTYSLTWNAAANSSNYRLEEKLGSGSWVQVYSGSSPASTQGSNVPGTYSYRVKGCNPESVCGGWSATRVVTVQAAPSTPGGLTAPVTDNDGAYTVSWSSSTNSTSYRLEEQVGAGAFTVIYSGSSLSSAVSGKSNGTYSYRVKGCIPESVCSAWSAIETVTVTLPPAIPGAISGPDGDADGTYILDWGSVTGAISYPIERRVDGGSWAQIQNTSGTTRSESGLADGAWDYRVQACDATQCSAWTANKTVNVATAPGVPGPITGPDEVAESSGAYTINWTDSVGTTTSYELQESVNNMTSWTTIQNTSAKTSAFSGKTVATYYYRVRGCNTVGNYSNCGLYTGKFIDVQDFQLLNVSSPATSETGSFIVSWNTGSGVQDILQVSAYGNAWVDLYTGQDGRYALAGQPNGTYRYRIERFMVVNEIEWYEYSYSSTTVVGMIPEPPIVPGSSAGNMPYQTGVTKGGNGYITIPIAAAPGVNGLQPQLSFVYNSGRGRQQINESLAGDTLGYGWSIGGFSTIRRCIKDTTASVIAMTTTDRLCLNGEPLVVTLGNYWSPGSEYRTLRDSFHKIVMQGTSSEPWFEVHTPDGHVVEFGNTDDSRIRNFDYNVVNGQQVEVLTDPYLWSINRLVDPFGNEMTFSYYQDVASGVNHPKSIVYGFNADSEIRFEYIGRNDLDPVTLGSTTLEQLLLLHTVRVRTASKTVREYVLESETTTPDGWRRLNKLQLCGYDENGITFECLAPLDFDWQEPSAALPNLKTYVDKVTDAQGAVTEFTHEIIKDSGTQSFVLTESEQPFGSEITPSNTDAVPATNGNVKSVVTSVKRSDGIGGMHTTSYAYHGRGFASTKNWGYLGFYGSRVTDEQSGIVTYHQYRLDFPHFAKESATRQYDANYPSHTELLTQTETALDAKQISYGSATTYLPYRKTLTSSLLEGGTEIGVVESTNILSVVGGFATQLDNTSVVAGSKQVASSGGSFWGDVPTYTLSGIKRSVVTERVFNNDTSGVNWLLGFQGSIETRKYRGSVASGPLDQTQSGSFTRLAGTNEIGSRVAFPADPEYALTIGYAYDSRGNVTSTTMSGVNVASRTSSANNVVQGRYPTFVRNALNHDTYTVFDARFGIIKTSTDPNNRQTSVVYDGFGREVSRTTADGIVVTTNFDRCVDVGCALVGSVAPVVRVQTSSSISPTSRHYLDALGRTIRREVESFNGTYVRQDTEYDNQGRVERVSQPYLAGNTAHFVSYDYDLRSRVKRQDRPDGSHTAIAFSIETGVGVKVTTTEEVNDSAGALIENQVKVNTYNLTGELASTIDDSGGDNVRTDYEFYASGLPKTISVDPSGANLQTTFLFDDAGLRTSISGPDVGTVTAKYTALGQLREQTDNAGNTVTFGHDLLGRRTSKNDPDGTGSWTYDPTNAIGALATRSYGTDFSETFAYYPDSRLQRIDSTLIGGGYTKNYSHEYSYDSSGRIDTVQYPSGITAEYGFNSYGYLESVTDIATAIELQSFSQVDAFGNVELESFGNGVQTARAFDAKTGRITDIDTTLGSTSFQDNHYQWRSNGILESRTQINGATTLREDFSYDSLNRLTKSESFVNSVLSRTLDTGFDDRGNIQFKTSSVAADTDVSNYQYATAKNRLDGVTIGGIVYALTYNGNGSIIRYDRAGTGDDKFIDWNGRNLPKTVVVGDSLTDTTPTAKDEFSYGPGGQRFYKKSTWDDSGTQKVEHTFYLGDFEELLTDASDPDHKAVQKSRIGRSVLHIKTIDYMNVAANSIEYLHRDHLGSVESVTDEQGNELRVLAYDPYGERRKDDWLRQLNGTEIDTLADDLRKSSSRGFTGQENLDRTGFVHMNGRIFDPQLGRFLSADPMVQAPGFSQSWNRYSYVMNSPMSFNDPSGYVRQPSNPNDFCATSSVCMNLSGNQNPNAGIGGSAGGMSVPYLFSVVVRQMIDFWAPSYIQFYSGGLFGGNDCLNCRGGINRNPGFSRVVWELVTIVVEREVTTTVQRDVSVTESSETDEPADLRDEGFQDAVRTAISEAIVYKNFQSRDLGQVQNRVGLYINRSFDGYRLTRPNEAAGASISGLGFGSEGAPGTVVGWVVVSPSADLTRAEYLEYQTIAEEAGVPLYYVTTSYRISRVQPTFRTERPVFRSVFTPNTVFRISGSEGALSRGSACQVVRGGGACPD